MEKRKTDRQGKILGSLVMWHGKLSTCKLIHSFGACKIWISMITHHVSMALDDSHCSLYPSPQKNAHTYTTHTLL